MFSKVTFPCFHVLNFLYKIVTGFHSIICLLIHKMGKYEIYSIYTDLVILKTKKMMYNFVSIIYNFIHFFISFMLYLYVHANTHMHTSISIFITYNVRGLFIKVIQVEYLFMHTHQHTHKIM